MRFLGLGTPEIDAVHHREEEAIADRLDRRAAGHEERQDRRPPEQVFRDIGRVPGETVRAIGHHTAIGEVGETQPESEGRPGIDPGQHHQQRAPQRDQRVIARHPVQPARGIVFVIDCPAAAEDAPHDRRVTDQSRDPAAQQRIARTDMRIERAHGDDIADGADHHVDHEHRLDDRQRDPFGPCKHLGEVRGHDMVEGEGGDREHEGGEEGLDDPRFPVLGDLAHVPARAHQQQRAEMPRGIAPVHQRAVDPQDIGHREHHQGQRGIGEHLYREDILPLPVPATQAVKPCDDRPGRPQSDQLDQRDTVIGFAAAHQRPVEPGRCAQMHLVDQDRPCRHRDRGGEQAHQRGIAPAQRIERDRPVEGFGKGWKGARERHPGKEPGQTHQPHGRGDIALWPREGCLFRRVHNRTSLARFG